ncbi:uncharacterized protein LOC142002365 isoform X2 [Carettochelys insculpta]|uniref:uncharacterized protein LOC142002365 isoform X2 n=1 Tax=Carettochelys insculpta TaxID=44489 RepID=UPI003EC129AC
MKLTKLSWLWGTLGFEFWVTVQFPEVFIGDSEDILKKPPTGKNTFGTRRNEGLTSSLNADEESHQNNSLAESLERKELREMGEEEEEEEEAEPHQGIPGSNPEDECSELMIKETVGDGAQLELGATFTSNREEQLEAQMSELGSLSTNLETEGKTTPSFFRPEHLGNSPEDSESYCLLDEESILSDSAVSTGYFPCYRTYVELPRYQLPRSMSSHPAEAEGGAGSSCDVSIQCSGGFEEDPRFSDMEASDTPQGSWDGREAVTCETTQSSPITPSREPLVEGKRLPTPGKEVEGWTEGVSSHQQPAEEKQRGFGPEIETSGSSHDGGHRKPSPHSHSMTSGKPACEEPRPTPSRLSLRSLISWVQKIFRRSSVVKSQAGGIWGTEDRGQMSSRLRLWISRRRNRVYPR